MNIKNLIHIDTYRLENEAELRAIGVADYLEDPDTVCVIEWPEKIPTLLKELKQNPISIFIEHIDSQTRKITIA